MDISAHVTTVQASLADLAWDDDNSQAIAQRLASAIGPVLQLQFLDALGEVALELTEQIPEGRVEVQLAGRDAVLVYRVDPTAPAAPASDEGSDTARLTLRMPEALKVAIEAAATTEGISTNAWLVTAARGHLAPTTSRRGTASSSRRISGYVQN